MLKREKGRKLLLESSCASPCDLDGKRRVIHASQDILTVAMRDLHTFREQFGAKLKRGADVKTTQDASAERTATGLLREEEVAAPKTKKAKQGKRWWCGRVRRSWATISQPMRSFKWCDRDYAGQNRARQCYKPDGKRVRLHIGADSLLS